MNAKNTAKYFFECGELKREKRTGWWYAGVKNPESVAEHSWRTGVIAYVLASEEGLNADKAAAAGLFHDLLETRLGDRHKISTAYLKTPKRVSKKIQHDQAKQLGETGDRILQLLEDEKLHVIVKDADYLECCLQAKEYMDVGFTTAEDWFKRAGSVLKTKSAKRIFKELKTMRSSLWWKGLKQKMREL
ncbi:MAG: HD domain-containing protein [Candidatus Micrarchaeota archaeon]